jgi:hypothetical protein
LHKIAVVWPIGRGSAEEVTQFYLRVRFGYPALPFQRARCPLAHSQDGCATVMVVESMEQRTLERIRQEFQEADLDGVIELLASYSGPESDRVRWDILELSKGELGKIGEYVKAAQSDYRDILYWAEYYKNDPLLRGRDPKQVVEEIIAKWGKKNE